MLLNFNDIVFFVFFCKKVYLSAIVLRFSVLCCLCAALLYYYLFYAFLWVLYVVLLRFFVSFFLV